MSAFHKPGATEVVEAWESGYVAEMDTTALGWAVQRTGAGREKAGEPVDPHAGILFHARRGAKVEKGEPVATVYATKPEMLAEPVEILKRAIVFSKTPPSQCRSWGGCSRKKMRRRISLRSRVSSFANADCSGQAGNVFSSMSGGFWSKSLERIQRGRTTK